MGSKCCGRNVVEISGSLEEPSVQTVDTGFGTISVEVRGAAGPSNGPDAALSADSFPVQLGKGIEKVRDSEGLTQMTRDLQEMLDAWKGLLREAGDFLYF